MRHRSYTTALRTIAREAARAKRARESAKVQQAAAQRRAVRDRELRTKADAKEAARAHLAGQMEEADTLTKEVQERESAIENLLGRALAISPSFNIDSNLTTFSLAQFDERPWQQVAPEVANYLPEAPGFFGRLMPGAGGRHLRKTQQAVQLHSIAHDDYLASRVAREDALRQFLRLEQIRRAKCESDNDKVNAFKRDLSDNEHGAVIRYFKLVFDQGLRGEPDALSADLGYSPES